MPPLYPRPACPVPPAAAARADASELRRKEGICNFKMAGNVGKNNVINHPNLGMVYTRYKNGDGWGMVSDIVLLTLMDKLNWDVVAHPLLQLGL